MEIYDVLCACICCVRKALQKRKVIANLLLKNYSKFAIIFSRKAILCTELNSMKIKTENLK